jgi:hypothetical protein
VNKIASPVLVLAALAALLVGCGSSNSSGSGKPSGGGGVNGISVGNCLNEDENFLVQPSQRTLDGQSPAGVSFTMVLYKDPAAAQKAAEKKNKKTTAIVENAVIDFKGNPSIFAGAPPAKISNSELNSIKRCIEKSKSQ